jgi:hypothetical protein
MSDQRDIDSLNRLLRAESGSLIHRLAEASPHVSWPAAGDHLIVQEMRSEILDHQQSLATMILDLRGAPSPPGYPIQTGSVHYLELSFLMPLVIDNMRRLISLYETAGVRSHDAAALVNRILGDHRRHLSQLERIHSNLTQRV